LHNEEYFVLIPKYYSADQIKESEVGGAYGTHERGECTGFWWESQKKIDHLEDQGVDGTMGSEWFLGRVARGVWSESSCLKIGTVGGL
jgi:hypothetical protein